MFAYQFATLLHARLQLTTNMVSKRVIWASAWDLQQPAKPQISLRIRAVWSEPLLVARVFYDC